MPMADVRGVALVGPGQLEEIRLPLPALGDDDALLRVDGCGVCGVDVALHDGRGPAQRLPVVLGHEVVGTITAIGPLAAGRWDVRVGDRVVVEEAIPCRRCRRCSGGRGRLCRERPRYGHTPPDVTPGLWGGYAEALYLHPDAVVHRADEALPVDLATLFVPVANGIAWLSEAASLRPGDSVVVLGPGQHGLACVAAARRLGAGPVVVAGLPADRERLAAAEALGATATTSDTQRLAALVDRVTDGHGADVVIDITPGAGDPIRTAVELAAVGGCIVLAGSKDGAVDGFPANEVFRKELTLRGVYARHSSAVEVALRWLADDPDAFAPLRGPTFSLSQLDTALAVAAGRTGSRPPHVTVVPQT